MQDVRKRVGQALIAVGHINQAVAKRISHKNRVYVSLALKNCVKSINLKKMPSCDWYSPIHNKGILIGHVVGTCNEISSVLLPNMKPKGRKIL